MHARDSDGWDASMWASDHGHIAACTVLLNRGADPDSNNQHASVEQRTGAAPPICAGYYAGPLCACWCAATSSPGSSQGLLIFPSPYLLMINSLLPHDAVIPQVPIGTPEQYRPTLHGLSFFAEDVCTLHNLQLYILYHGSTFWKLVAAFL